MKDIGFDVIKLLLW